MRPSLVRQGNRRVVLFLILIVGLLGVAPLFTSAAPPAISITIVNNSTGWEIRHLYFSPVDRDNWGPDQLNGSVISSSGGSQTLGNVSCDAASIKVITEDQNGCFLYKTVSCVENSTWTITNDAAPDCGN